MFRSRAGMWGSVDGAEWVAAAQIHVCLMSTRNYQEPCQLPVSRPNHPGLLPALLSFGLPLSFGLLLSFGLAQANDTYEVCYFHFAVCAYYEAWAVQADLQPRWAADQPWQEISCASPGAFVSVKFSLKA